jgi:intergrase/recombinase
LCRCADRWAGRPEQQLAKLKPEHIESLYRVMLDSGLSLSTVLRTHRILSRALKGHAVGP